MTSAVRQTRYDGAITAPRGLARIQILLAPDMDSFIIPLERARTYKDLILMLQCLFGADFCSKNNPPLLSSIFNGMRIDPEDWPYLVGENLSVIVTAPEKVLKPNFGYRGSLEIEEIGARDAKHSSTRVNNLRIDTTYAYGGYARNQRPQSIIVYQEEPHRVETTRQENKNSTLNIEATQSPKIKKKALWTAVVSAFSTHSSLKEDGVNNLEHKFNDARERQRYVPKKQKQTKKNEKTNWSNRREFDQELIEQMGLARPTKPQKNEKKASTVDLSRGPSIKNKLMPNPPIIPQEKQIVHKPSVTSINKPLEFVGPFGYTHAAINRVKGQELRNQKSTDNLSTCAIPSSASSVIDLAQFPDVPEFNLKLLKGTLFQDSAEAPVVPRVPLRGSSAAVLPAKVVKTSPSDDVKDQIREAMCKERALSSGVKEFVAVRIEEDGDITVVKKSRPRRISIRRSTVTSVDGSNSPVSPTSSITSSTPTSPVSPISPQSSISSASSLSSICPASPTLRPATSGVDSSPPEMPQFNFDLFSLQRPSTSSAESSQPPSRRGTDTGISSTGSRPSTAGSGRSRSKSEAVPTRRPATSHETAPRKLSPFPPTRACYLNNQDALLTAAVKKQLVPPVATFEDFMRSRSSLSEVDRVHGVTSKTNKRKSLKDVVGLRKISA